MSTKATSINRQAARRAASSAREAVLARAVAEAEKAEQAAEAARKAAAEARAAAEAGDVARAGKAAGAAAAARRGSESAALLATTFAARAVAPRKAADQVLAGALDRSARYLVTYNGQLVAAFLREDDALLFEAELADLDCAHGVESALCEVRSRRGQRLGGYLLTAGRLLSFVRDRDFGRRFGRA